MATAYTYAELFTDVSGFIENPDTDFQTDVFPSMVKLAEDRCLLDLNLSIFDVADSITLTQGSALASLPADWLRVLTMEYVASGSRVAMEQRSYEYIRDYWPSTTAQDSPLYYAPYSETQIYVGPTPSATVSASAMGVKRPASLVTATSGTWLSLNCGSLLLMACLVASEQFELADDRIEMWRTEYGAALDAARLEHRHLIRVEYDLPPLPQPQER